MDSIESLGEIPGVDEGEVRQIYFVGDKRLVEAICNAIHEIASDRNLPYWELGVHPMTDKVSFDGPDYEWDDNGEPIYERQSKTIGAKT